MELDRESLANAITMHLTPVIQSHARVLRGGYTLEPTESITFHGPSATRSMVDSIAAEIDREIFERMAALTMAPVNLHEAYTQFILNAREPDRLFTTTVTRYKTPTGSIRYMQPTQL